MAAAVDTTATADKAPAVEAPVAETPAEPQKPAQADKSETVYKLQILVSSKKRALNDPIFTGRKDVEELKESVGYKYFIGASTNYDEVAALKSKLGNTFSGAFIVAYKDGKRVNVTDTIKNK